MHKNIFFLVFSALLCLCSEQAGATMPKTEKSVEPIAESTPTISRLGGYLAGRHANQKGDTDKASFYFSNTLEHDPTEKEVLKQAILTNLESGKLDEALTIAEKLAALGEYTQSSSLLLAIKSIRAHDYNAAKTMLDKIDLFGLLSSAKPMLGGWVNFAQTGIVTDISFESLNQSYYFDSALRYQKALMYDLAGNKTLAEENYRNAVRELETVSYRMVFAFMDFYRRNNRELEALDLFKKYKNANQDVFLLQGMEAEEVIDWLKNTAKPRLISTSLDGVSESLFIAASMLAYGDELGSEAQLYLELVNYLQTDINDSAFLSASLSEIRGRKEEAIAEYKKVTPENILYRHAQIRIAFCLASLGQEKSAYELLEKLKTAYPQKLDIAIAIADTLRNTGHFIEAIAEYNNALELGKSKEKDGQLTQQHWPILYARGISYERAGDWKKAEDDLQQALTLSPHQPDILNYLGYSWLLQERNLDMAKKYLEEAAASRPEDPFIIDSLGWAYYKMGNYADAKDYLEQALSIMPSDPTINDHLGDILFKLGEKESAIVKWKAAAKLLTEASERLKLENKIKDASN